MSEHNESEPTLKPVTFWQLHKNPILLRYMRSRMRWNGLSAAVILTVVGTIFTFLLFYNGFMDSMETEEDRFRAVFIPIFLIQIIIMLLLGTGAVAGGITQEYDDGMVEYQRLTPMTPMAKIVGYLFGLPIREWFMFGITTVATTVIAVKGNLPIGSLAKVYSIFFLTVILYHLLALIVVHNMKKKRVASRVIQLLVIVLYFLLPNLSAFGLVFFEYLTVRPVMAEEMSKYIPESAVIMNFLGMDNLKATVPFFTERVESWNFSVMVQLSLVISFIVMLRRRWKDATSHLMSKPFAIIFFGYFLFVLLGNSIPIAQKGFTRIGERLAKSQIERMEERVNEMEPGEEQTLAMEEMKERVIEINEGVEAGAPIELVITQTIFCTICVALACLLVFVITPSKEKYVVGLRRSRNQKKKWIPMHWDEASGFITTLAIAGILSYGLYSFAPILYRARNVPIVMETVIPIIPIVILFTVTVVIAFQLVYEAWEKKGLFFLLLFVWVLPLMVAMILQVRHVPFDQVIWVSGISPITAYSWGMSPYGAYFPFKQAFFLSFIIQAVIASVAGLKVLSNKFSARRAVMAEVQDDDPSEDEPSEPKPSHIDEVLQA